MMRRLSGLLLIALVLVHAPARAQTRAATADVAGTILDQTGAVLPGVAVSIVNIDTGLDRTAASDREGRFGVAGLPAGSYRLRAELSGFVTRLIENIQLTVGFAADLEIVMAVAGPNEQVIVSRPASPIVSPQKTDVSSVIVRQQIDDLPINGRTFIAFSALTPGVHTDRGAANITSGLTFAGQRGRSNNVSLDGLDDNDANLGAIRVTVSQDAVREFQVMTNSFPAEFGKASGGVVNIVTRSGTNRFDGRAFVYIRDESLNAKNYFERFDPSGGRLDRPKAPFGQQQYGGVLGGPIRRDRTFFFGSFERQDTAASKFVNIDDVTIVPHPFAPVPLGTAAEILRKAGFVVDNGSVPYAIVVDQFLARVDHQVRTGQSTGVRFSHTDGLNESITEFGGSVARSRGTALDSRYDEVAGWWTSVLSQRLLNDVRLQFSRGRLDALSLDPACGGPCTTNDQGGPGVDVLGVATLGRSGSSPQHARPTLLQVLDTVTYVGGRHQWKAGIDLGYRHSAAVDFPLEFGGHYFFADIPDAIAPLLGLPKGFSAIQAVALGLPAAYVQGYGNPTIPAASFRDLSLFVQDDWRLRNTVTVKAGVRYQRQSTPDYSYEVPDLSYRYPQDDNNLAPRLAVAWDPDGQRRTSIHAAHGLFFDHAINATAGLTRVYDPATGLRLFVGQGLPAFVGWGSPGRRLPAASLGSIPSLRFTIDPGFQTPYAHHSSIGIDRELRAGLSLSASFVRVNGHHQIGLVDYNPLVPALGPGRRPDDRDGVPGTSASLLQYSAFGETWYRGLLVSIGNRFDGRSQFLVSYTLSKAEDTATDFVTQPAANGRGRNPADPTGPPLGFDPLQEKGPSTQDERHHLVVSGTRLLPLHFVVSAIVAVGSGRPYNIRAGLDVNGDAVPGDPDRPFRDLGDPGSTIGRNAGRLPAQATVDVRLARSFPAGRARIEALLEVFNLFNRVNYTEVNGVFGPGPYPGSPAPRFGQFTQAGPQRQVQLAARLIF